MVSVELLPYELDAQLNDFCSAFERKLKQRPQVKASTTWYTEAFSTFGSWDSWSYGSVLERPYGSDRPHFDGFVVCLDPMGRAAAEIVRIALHHKRVVLQFKNGELLQVQRLLTNNPESWKDGWSVQSCPIQEIS